MRCRPGDLQPLELWWPSGGFLVHVPAIDRSPLTPLRGACAPGLLLLAALGALAPGCDGWRDKSGRPDDTGPAPVLDAEHGVAARAVIVVMDGVRMEESFGDGESDAWGGPTAEVMPRIRHDLRRQGGVAQPAYVTGTTFTSSAHANLLTGVRQYYPNMGSSTGYARRQPDHPTLFEQLRVERDLGPEQVVLAANTTILGDLVYGHAPGYGRDYAGQYLHVTVSGDSNANAQDDGMVLTRVKSSLDRDDAVFVLANLHQIDRSGHSNAPVYANYVADVDRPLVDLWKGLRGAERRGEDLPLVVVMSDHGRHRFVDEESPWQDHGCSCTGCREVPLLIMGPGIEAGAVATAPALLEDVTHTVAWLMGVPMPYSTGLALDEFLVGAPDVPVRSGEVALAADGDLVAWQRWEPTREARSSVVVDDQVLAQGVLHVEQPTVARGDGVDFACWRQLDLVEGAERWPWEGHCARRVADGPWEDLALLTGELPDGFEAQLEVDKQGRLWVLFLGGVESVGMDAITPSTVGYLLARWDDARSSWEYSTALRGRDRFPSNARLRLVDGELWVATVRSDDEASMRYSRHVVLSTVRWATGGLPVWREVASLYPTDSDNTEVDRVERPALGVVGRGLVVAAVGYSDEGTYLMASSQLSTGTGEQEWSELVTLDDSGRVYPHLSPAISDDGWLYWARQAGAGGVTICRADSADATPTCHDTGSGWIDSLAPASGGVWASLSDGDLSWSRVWVPF